MRLVSGGGHFDGVLTRLWGIHELHFHYIFSDRSAVNQGVLPSLIVRPDVDLFSAEEVCYCVCGADAVTDDLSLSHGHTLDRRYPTRQ